MNPSYQILTNLTCNLACTYCYEKQTGRVNNIEYIKAFLRNRMARDKGISETLSVEYIGGESLLVVALLEQTNAFVLETMGEYGFKYAQFFHSTNGTRFLDPKVQAYMERYKDGAYYGVSIDGTEEIHDTCRVYKKGGKGSYQDIIKGMEWVKANIGSDKLNIKATYTSETYQYYLEGLKNLISLGINNINANLIFEETYSKEWGAKAALVLIELVDYIIDNDLQDTINLTHMLDKGKFVTFYEDFSSYRPFFKMGHNYCGSCDPMRCLGFDGLIYGCNRFVTMGKPNKEIAVMDANGIITPVNQELEKAVVEQYKAIPEECKVCPIQATCSTCVAIAYEQEEEDIEAYLSQKKQCGWTWAKVIACRYGQRRLDARKA